MNLMKSQKDFPVPALYFMNLLKPFTERHHKVAFVSVKSISLDYCWTEIEMNPSQALLHQLKVCDLDCHIVCTEIFVMLFNCLYNKS